MLPEARQCRIEGDSWYGAVAVRAGVDNWSVAHPVYGQSAWATDVDVIDWDVFVVSEGG
jgi:hypothetical protein